MDIVGYIEDTKKTINKWECLNNGINNTGENNNKICFK